MKWVVLEQYDEEWSIRNINKQTNKQWSEEKLNKWLQFKSGLKDTVMLSGGVWKRERERERQREQEGERQILGEEEYPIGKVNQMFLLEFEGLNYSTLFAYLSQ